MHIDLSSKCALTEMMISLFLIYVLFNQKEYLIMLIVKPLTVLEYFCSCISLLINIIFSCALLTYVMRLDPRFMEEISECALTCHNYTFAYSHWVQISLINVMKRKFSHTSTPFSIPTLQCKLQNIWKKSRNCVISEYLEKNQELHHFVKQL